MQTMTGYRFADVVLPLDGSPARFAFLHPLVGAHPPMPAAVQAVCPRRDHATPHLDCDCGFSAPGSLEELLAADDPSVAGLCDAALVEVELSTPLLIEEHRVRAGRQRVARVALLPLCRGCVAAETEPDRVDAYLRRVVDGTSPNPIVVRCPDHAEAAGLMPFEPDSLEELAGVAIDWLDDTVTAGLRDHLDRRRAAGHPTGPTLASRRVAELRMGHIGFVAPEALRRDADGRYHLDLDATAPQHPDDTHPLPVQRTLELTYELLLTADTAPLLAAVRRDGDPARREKPIAKVRGRRHLPTDQPSSH